MCALPMNVWPVPVGGIVDTKLNTAVVPITKTVPDMAAPVDRFRPVPMNWFPPLESKKKINWSEKGGGEKQKGPMGAAFAGVPTPPSSPTIIPTMTNNLFMPSSPFVAVLGPRHLTAMLTSRCDSYRICVRTRRVILHRSKLTVKARRGVDFHSRGVLEPGSTPTRRPPHGPELHPRGRHLPEAGARLARRELAARGGQDAR